MFRCSWGRTPAFAFFGTSSVSPTPPLHQRAEVVMSAATFINSREAFVEPYALVWSADKRSIAGWDTTLNRR